jgi:hypothetical protein
MQYGDCTLDRLIAVERVKSHLRRVERRRKHGPADARMPLQPDDGKDHHQAEQYRHGANRQETPEVEPAE